MIISQEGNPESPRLARMSSPYSRTCVPDIHTSLSVPHWTLFVLPGVVLYHNPQPAVTTDCLSEKTGASQKLIKVPDTYCFWKIRVRHRAENQPLLTCSDSFCVVDPECAVGCLKASCGLMLTIRTWSQGSCSEHKQLRCMWLQRSHFLTNFSGFSRSVKVKVANELQSILRV